MVSTPPPAVADPGEGVANRENHEFKLMRLVTLVREADAMMSSELGG